MDFSTISSISTTTPNQDICPIAIDSVAHLHATVSMIQNISMNSSTCNINILTPFLVFSSCFLVFWYFQPMDKRRILRSASTGAWLTTMPSLLNGSDLSAEEFRDGVRLRLGLTPKALPPPVAMAAVRNSPPSMPCHARRGAWSSTATTTSWRRGDTSAAKPTPLPQSPTSH